MSDDFGGFGGFGGGGDTGGGDAFGGFGDDDALSEASVPSQSSASPALKKKRASQRTNMYAKSPMQRQQEQAEAAEYQALLEAEQSKQQSGGFGGFGDFDDGGSGDAQKKQNVWGQAPNALGVVIPPFVPRDQRNAKVWDAGKIKKSTSDKSVMGASHGSFLIRETMKGDRHVVCVNDHGSLFEMYIRHLPGDRFMFMSREFDKLEDIVKHLQRNALYNKQGLPLYIDKPIAVAR